MLSWIFGDVKSSIVHVSRPDKAAGYLELEKARVRWFLSVDYDDIPNALKEKGQRTYRSIRIADELEFSEGFTDLHTTSYRGFLQVIGSGLNDARSSIETVYTIRNMVPVGLTGDYHPFCKH